MADLCPQGHRPCPTGGLTQTYGCPAVPQLKHLLRGPTVCPDACQPHLSGVKLTLTSRTLHKCARARIRTGIGRLHPLAFRWTGRKPCHIHLQGGGTQLALFQELAGPEGSIAAAGGARTPLRSCARVYHCDQGRTSVRLTLLHLTYSPFGEGTLRSQTDWVRCMTTGRTSAGGAFVRHSVGCESPLPCMSQCSI